MLFLRKPVTVPAFAVSSVASIAETVGLAADTFPVPVVIYGPTLAVWVVSVAAHLSAHLAEQNRRTADESAAKAIAAARQQVKDEFAKLRPLILAEVGEHQEELREQVLQRLDSYEANGLASLLVDSTDRPHHPRPRPRPRPSGVVQRGDNVRHIH